MGPAWGSALGGPYHVARFSSLTTLPTQGVPQTMTAHIAAALAPLAEGGNHQSLSPFLTGGGALFILLLLLWIVTRFNRDR
jgi:hypothetical protein